MREEEKTWFDDPEWERLRQEVNGRPIFGEHSRFRLFGKRAAQVPQRQAPLPTMPQQTVQPQTTPSQPRTVQATRPIHPGRPQQYVQPQPIRSTYRRPLGGVQESVQTAQTTPKNVSISLNLTLPKIRLLDNKVVKKVRAIRLSNKQWVMVGTACLVMAVSFGGLKVFGNNKGKGTEVTTGVLGTSAPEYKPVLPDGSEQGIADQQVRYDSEKKVASYADTINGVPITVSQQPLPENFNNDPDEEVKKIALNFNATKEIKAGGLTGYLGTSAQGPQSMILKKRSMLIFIFSQKTIPDNDWGIYIASLE
jgi:hypothetical protein